MVKTNMTKYFFAAVLIIAVALTLSGARVVGQASELTGFAALDQWKAAVLAGDAGTLRTFYSTDPVAEIETNGATSRADDDVSFWLGLKAKSMKIEIVRLKEKPPDAESVIFKAEVQTGNGEILNVTDAQGWRKQGDAWRIVGAERTDAPHLKQPSDMKKNIYPPDADAHSEIKEAEEKAAAEHKRVLLVFGANWCFDCHVLDLAFQRADFAPAVAPYEVVHVDIGDDGKRTTIWRSSLMCRWTRGFRHWR